MRKEKLDLRFHERVALDEIELYAELLSAVAAAERPLTVEEIDSVLGVRAQHPGSVERERVSAAVQAEKHAGGRAEGRVKSLRRSPRPERDIAVAPADVYRRAQQQAAAERSSRDLSAGLERLNRWMGNPASRSLGDDTPV